MLEMLRRWLNLFSAKVQGVAVEEIDPMSLPLIDRCRYVYEHLNVVAYADYRRQHGNGKIVTVVHQSIDACINDIASHIASLEHGGYILPARVEYKAVDKPINRFFVTTEGYYLPSVRDKVQELVDIVRGVQDAINEAKETHPDTQSYNLRMLNSLLHVLLELGLTLTDISQEILVSH